MENIIAQMRCELRENATGHRMEADKRFFKEEIKPIGVRTPVAIKIGKEAFRKISNLPKKEIFALCEELWKDGYQEECYIACNWSYYIRNLYQPKDFKIFDKWVNKYVTNWATCDTLCNHSVGTFVEMYPEYIEKLKKWAQSNNSWVKRAAVVSLIIPARKGLFRKEVFEMADILLNDPNDLVQKGYGWMLKAAADYEKQDVFEYVMSKRAVMPRTSLRYAIEKMPPEMKKQAMAKL